MNGLKKAKECIAKAKEIVVASHVNPDGDSIGSLLSLGLGLEKLGKRVYMISHDAIPQKYRRLPGANRILRKINKAKFTKRLEYRRHVTMIADVDGTFIEVNMDNLKENFKKAQDFIDYIENNYS